MKAVIVRLVVVLSLASGTAGKAELNPAGAHDGDWKSACTDLHHVFKNQTNFLEADCGNLIMPSSNSVSGGYCLASMVAAGYYRTSVVNPIFDAILGLTGALGLTPVVTGTNSGGTMFIVRYFALRDNSREFLWTYPCYLLKTGYRTTCFLHGNFGAISEECYSENQNLVGLATGIVYGQLMNSHGGPMGAVASYASVYFGFLNNLPIVPGDDNFHTFWKKNAHWNSNMDLSSEWTAAHTVVSPQEASGGDNNYNYGFDSWMSRGFMTNEDVQGGDWYKNMSVYTVASISANTLTGISMIPFSFAGKSWDSSGDETGVSSIYKMVGLVISYIMIKRLIQMNTILITTTKLGCESACPLLDGGFTDNGPITPVLAAASRRPDASKPRHLALLGPTNTMESIKYLLGQGSLGIWTGSGLNMCPFTQVTICDMVTRTRELVVPMLTYEDIGEYDAVSSHFRIFRPNQQVMQPFCADPLIFDHFLSQCMGDSICYTTNVAVPSILTDVVFSGAPHMFLLSMVWLKPTTLAARFVEKYVPNAVLRIKYYANLASWFPDFVAVAPQKGGVGFTKIAGHAILDYLTYLVERLINIEVLMRNLAHNIFHGFMPPCGYAVFRAARNMHVDSSGKSKIL